MGKKLSIIVPVYNVEKFLDECIQSIINQSFADFEIILIDDGSQDRSSQICDNYGRIDNRVSVIHKSNGGLADARNCGLRQAKGKYVAFVDSDDILPKDSLSQLINEIETSDADIVLGKMQRFIEGGPIRPYSQLSEKREMTNYETLKMILNGSQMNISLCGGIYKRSVWEGLEMPLGYICEDWYITPHLYFKAKKVVFLPIDSYMYRDNPISIMGLLQKKCNSQVIEVAKHVIEVIRGENEELYYQTLWSNVKRVWKYVGIVYKGGRNKQEKDFLEKVRFFIKSYFFDLLKTGNMNAMEFIGVLSFCYCPPLCRFLYKLK